MIRTDRILTEEELYRLTRDFSSKNLEVIAPGICSLIEKSRSKKNKNGAVYSYHLKKETENRSSIELDYSGRKDESILKTVIVFKTDILQKTSDMLGDKSHLSEEKMKKNNLDGFFTKEAYVLINDELESWQYTFNLTTVDPKNTLEVKS